MNPGEVNEIRGARERLQYRMKYMADMLGISVESYRKKECGQVKWTDEEKMRIAEILGLTNGQLNQYLYAGKLPIGRDPNELFKYSD